MPKRPLVDVIPFTDKLPATCPTDCKLLQMSGIRSKEEAISWGLRNEVYVVYHNSQRGRVYAFRRKGSNAT